MYFLLIVLVLCVTALLLDRWRASSVFAVTALVLLLSHQVTVVDFLKGFSNPTIISIFLLIIITSVINEHYNLVGFFDRIFAGATTARNFNLRLGFSLAGLSSVMNNTPIVAMMMPYVYQWGKRKNIAPSRLLIPFVYSVSLGGMITVIGTSTNLVLNGFIQSKDGEPLAFLDFFIPGILVTVFGVLFIALIGQRLLPDRGDIIDKVTANIKEYLMETKLSPNSALVGKTVNEAGLRNLDGIFLVEILRDKEVISPVTPETKIHTGDRLFFAGESDKVAELVHRNKGLEIPAQTSLQKEAGMKIMECVIPSNSELVGKTLKEIEFRDRYDAAVIGIHRNSERLRGKIGEIELDKGDLLLISAGPSFLGQNKAGKDLYSVSGIKTYKESDPVKKKAFLAVLLAAITLTAIGVIPMFMALLVILGGAAFLGFTNFDHIKKNLPLDLLIILGGALTLSEALINSGTANWIGQHIHNFLGDSGPWIVILTVYIFTLGITQFVTNSATVAIVFPLGYSLAGHLPCDPKAVYLAMAFAASCSFLTPVGYQTNMMVYGPGNYRFKDFARIGLPLTVIYSVLVLGWLFYRYL